MAGRGRAPKDPNKRAGHSPKDPIPLRVITAVPMGQPELPETIGWIGAFGVLLTMPMPEQTKTWWEMWAQSPLSKEFTSTDWSELLDTSILHARLWIGDHKVAGELRLRVAKFGATPEDRARLRITFATADAIEDKPFIVESSRVRRGGLKALTDVVG